MTTHVFTVGHSTRSSEELIEILATHEIEVLVDVRRFPNSRRLPQFNATSLEQSLLDHHIAYRWIESLGGRRPASKSSVNLGWRNASFRGYADYTASEEFAEGLFELLVIASGARSAIMCAEALWWRCHRRIIADVLTSSGVEVVHLLSAGSAETHRIVSPARIVRGVLSYANE